jgi:glycosyltransferase involved in cell wall biosynthesis
VGRILKKKIKIAFFASSFVGRSASGTAYVAKTIVKILLTKYKNEFQVVLFSKNDQESISLKKDPDLIGSLVVQLPTVKYSFLKSSRQFYKSCRSKTLKSLEIDVLHITVARFYPFFWFFPAKKFFCNYHSAGDITVKSDKFVLSKHIYNKIAKWQWTHFDAITALSEFARNEIHVNLKIPKCAVRVVPLGIDSFARNKPKKIVKLDSKKPFIAVLGRWQSFKNVSTACKAIRLIDFEPNENLHLVVVGKSGVTGSESVRNELSKHKVDDITVFDYLGEDQLVWLFRNAELVVIPSLNEGFGLPSFEAFASGARILVHQGTPASTILKNFRGVYSCDMEDYHEIQNSINYIRSLKNKVDFKNRQKEVSTLSLLWKDFGERQTEIYRDLINY